MTAQTARQMTFGRAPKRLDLHGDKGRKTEPAQHILTWPGGAVELTRLDDGSYWIHVLVTRDWADEEQDGRNAAFGEIVESRVMRRADFGGRASDPEDVPDADSIEQFALRIRPVQP